MKALTVYMHTHRAAGLVQALRETGIERVAFSPVSGMLHPLSDEGHSFSVELGSEVLREARLELICEDDQLEAIAHLIRRHARTGQSMAGYVVITEVVDVFVIDGGPHTLAPVPERRRRP